MRITYAQRGIQDEDVMLDFENSGIVIAAITTMEHRCLRTL